MPFGAVVPAALGAVTRPTTLVLGTAASVKTGLAPWGLYDVVPIQSRRALAFAHGVEAMRWVLEGSSLRLGLLAPPSGMTASGPARATATLTFTAATNPADGDAFTLNANTPLATTVQFKNTLGGGANHFQIKRGANLAATIASIEKTFNGTGVAGTDYSFASSFYGTFAIYLAALDAEVSATTATVVTFRAETYGTIGNTYTLAELIDGGGTWAAASFSGGAAATGTDPEAGDYRYALAHLRPADGAMSAVSLPYVQIEQTEPGNVALAAFPSFVSRDGTTHNRPFRSLVGQARLYKLGDTTASSFTDDVSDDILVGIEEERPTKLLKVDGTYAFDPRLFRPRVAGYPQVGTYGVVWKDRLWFAGAKKHGKYTTGTVALSRGSDVATFSTSARIKEDMIGWTLKGTNIIPTFQLVDIDASAHTARLNTTYEGPSTGAITYELSDDRDPCLLTYSEPGLFNNFPPQNSIEGVTSPDPYGVTGLVVAWDSLIVFTRTGVWRVTGESGAWRLQHIGEGMGAFCNQAVRSVGGVPYWLGPDGVWAWLGSDPVCISKPRDGEPEGIQGTIDRLNMDEGEMIVSAYNPSTHDLRWWVPLDGSTLNRHCIRYDLQARCFQCQTAADITAACVVPGPAGSFVTVVGDAYGCLWQIDVGNIDGVFGVEPVQTVASYTVASRILELTGVALSGTDLVGAPILIVPAAGPPYQMAKIAAHSGSNGVTLTGPIATAPAAGDKVILGGIPLDCITARFDYQQPEILKWLEGMVLSHEIESAATEVWVGACGDNDVPTVYVPRGGSAADSALVNDGTGEKHFWLYTERSRRLQVRILSFVRGFPVRLVGFVLSVRSPVMEEVEG